jgi:hypothetical protein
VDDHARSVDDRAQRGGKPGHQTGGSACCEGVGIRNLGAFSDCVPGSIKDSSECVNRLLATKSVDQLLHGPEAEKPIDARKLT